MPIDSVIHKESRRVYSTCTGKITLADFKRYHETVWGDPDLLGFQEVFDLTHADLSLMDFSDLLLLIDQATRVENFRPESRLAIINTREQEEKVSFYCSSKQFLRQPSRTILSFQDNNHALHWLESCEHSQPG